MEHELLESYLRLYEQAVDIENNSQSPRVLIMHDQNQHCQVGLGVSSPVDTRFLFFGICHGGNANVAQQTINQEFVKAYHGAGTMNWYLTNDDVGPYQRNMKCFLETMHNMGVNCNWTEWINMWGSCDVSFYNGARDNNDILMEAKESAEVIRQQIPKNIKALVFNGVWNQGWMRGLFPNIGGNINIPRTRRNGALELVEHATRTLWDGRKIECYHFVHFTGAIKMRNTNFRDSVATRLYELMGRDDLI